MQFLKLSYEPEVFVLPPVFEQLPKVANWLDKRF